MKRGDFYYLIDVEEAFSDSIHREIVAESLQVYAILFLVHGVLVVPYIPRINHPIILQTQLLTLQNKATC